MPSILVTGAMKGIGRAAAVELAGRGHRVIATAPDVNTLDDLEVSLRLPLDVTDQASVDAAVASAGEVDVLVSNAGLIFGGATEASPIAEIEKLFAVNTVGAIRVVQSVLPLMRSRGKGRLLFMSSTCGRTALPGNSAYTASKWALEGFIEALAMEVSPFGIDVALLEAGPVSSGALTSQRIYRLPDDPYPNLVIEDYPAEVMVAPEYVANMIGDLVEASHVPLRVPVGPVAEQILGARDAAPWDRPFVAF